MAVGLPLKTTYANGDVYSASDVNDTNGTINLLQTSTLSVAGGKNRVVNGGMDWWQRGTSFNFANTSSNYSADRWAAISATVGTMTRQTTSDTTNLPNIQYCARIQRTAAQTGTSAIGIYQFFESVNAIPYAGQTVTLSFYARRGANFSATSNALSANLYTGTGTDQNPFVAYTGSANPITGTATLTTTWQRFTFTGTLAATATELYISLGFTPTGTAGAADYFEITGVQLELGSYATTFSRAGGTIQGELAACQRYLQVWPPIAGTANAQTIANASYYSSTSAFATLQLPVEMRVAPAGTFTTVGNYIVFANSANKAATAISVDSASTRNVFLLATTAASTAGFAGLLAANNANGYIILSSEL
jgi:hypothetical protein